MAVAVKNPPANAGEVGDAGSIPGSETSPGAGHGNPVRTRAEEPGRLRSTGLQRARHERGDLAGTDGGRRSQWVTLSAELPGALRLQSTCLKDTRAARKGPSGTKRARA